MAHHEAVSEKIISLMWRGGKLTAQKLAQMMKKYLADMQKQKVSSKTPKTYQGKQSVKKLVGQGQGVSNIEITDGNIKSFERTARKYGVDFALKKDNSVDPPKWMAFFKAKDADAITAAFKEFSNKVLKKQQAKQAKTPLLEKVKQFKDKAAELAQNLIKNKQKERGGR